MPNWCNNELQISGTIANIKRFLEDGLPSEFEDYVVFYFKETEEDLEKAVNDFKEKNKDILLDFKLIDIPAVEKDHKDSYVYKARYKNVDNSFIFKNIVDDVDPVLLLGDGWYDERLKRIGSKWYPSDVYYDDYEIDKLYESDCCEYEESDIFLFFDSAWSPTIPLSEAISEKYDLTIRHNFSELGMMCAGEAIIEDGVTIEMTEREISEDEFF